MIVKKTISGLIIFSSSILLNADPIFADNVYSAKNSIVEKVLSLKKLEAIGFYNLSQLVVVRCPQTYEIDKVFVSHVKKHLLAPSDYVEREQLQQEILGFMSGFQFAYGLDMKGSEPSENKRLWCEMAVHETTTDKILFGFLLPMER